MKKNRRSKCEIRPEYKCQKRISNVHVNIKYSSWIRMSKKYLECHNLFIAPNSNVKIGFLMSKLDIRPHFECQNRILNGKMRYSAPIQIKKIGFQRRNAIFGANSNVDIGFHMSRWNIRHHFKNEFQNMILNVKSNIRSDLNDKIGFRRSKCDIRSEFECQNSLRDFKCEFC